MGSAAGHEHPQSVHILKLTKQAENGGDVVCLGRTQLVISLADEGLALVADEFAEIIGDFNVPAVQVDDGHVVVANDG